MKDIATILLVEDEETDAYFVEWAVKAVGLPHHICRVEDGQAAVDYLKGEAPFNDRLIHPLPNLVLLDLKMPRLDGFDVLAWMDGRPELKTIPVIVLTSSQHPLDRKRALDLGARDYLVKPGNPTVLRSMMQGLHARWLEPSGGSSSNGH